jgi:hypothetical protein
LCWRAPRIRRKSMGRVILIGDASSFASLDETPTTLCGNGPRPLKFSQKIP